MDCPEQLPVFVATLAAAIAENRGDDELALLSAVFVQLGDCLATILASRAMCE